ncbi:MAG: DUF4097 family beta strand repeat protein [Anaerolineae bacterium]|nr:DUF4097 family beta strand repeat protein [Gemmatimonadaceae bacterium]
MSLTSRMVVAASITAALIFAKTRFDDGEHNFDFDSDNPGNRTTEWTWQGTVPPGQWARIRNLNGAIKVESATGDELRVVAIKRWSRGDPDYVRIVTNKGDSDGDVTICALWGRGGRCDEDGYRSRSKRTTFGKMFGGKNDVSVLFNVSVPRGVKLDATTVNGEITILDVGEAVKASTVNGAIKAMTARGPLNASTVNGSITARVDSLVGDEGVTLSTVNGSVTAELPDEINGVIDLSTVNGKFWTNYPVDAPTEKQQRRLHATLGHGGPELKLSTVNGSVTLKRMVSNHERTVVRHEEALVKHEEAVRKHEQAVVRVQKVVKP